MDSEQYERVRELFLAARRKPTAERRAYLEEVCDDSYLSGEVLSLLEESEQLEQFLASPILGEDFRLEPALIPGQDPDARTPPPERMGSYRIERILGEGGMGLVYLARQRRPGRTVALKVLRPGLASPDRLRRFEREAEVLARLKHPGIAQIYEAGTFDAGRGPQPFFAMEYVEGQLIVEHAAARNLNLGARLRLVVRLCEAIQHAHNHGVIHRDLKPGNIIVDASGQPKILDFGVARTTDSDLETTTRVTDVGQLVGTVAYMSPEQVRAVPEELDTRTDVYSLGVLVYELLTGSLPYDVRNKSLAEAARTIEEEDPRQAGALDRILRGDVETILAKALEKDPARRYSTASALAADIQHFIDDEPIVARPPSAVYQLRKFTKRNKGLVGGLAAFVLALLVGIIATRVQYAQAEGQRKRAEQAEESAESLLEDSQRESRIAWETSAILRRMLSSVDPESGDRDVRFIEVLEQMEREISSDSVPGAGPPSAVEASLQVTLAATYRSLGLYARAAPLLEEAVEVLAETLGGEHPETLEARNQLGLLRYCQGRLTEAEEILRRVLEVRRRSLTDEHEDTLASLHDMALLRFAQGKHERAQELFEELLHWRERSGSEQDPELARARSNLAAVQAFRSHGAGDDSLEQLRESLDFESRLLGRRHPTTLVSMQNLGSTLHKRGRLEEAQDLLQETLHLRQRVLGEEHPDTLNTQNSLGNLRYGQGRYEEAEKLLSTCLAAQRRALGDVHAATLRSMSNLAAVLLAAGRPGEAEELQRELMHIQAEQGSEDDLETARACSNLAASLLSKGDLEAAERLLKKAIAIRTALLGPEDPGTVVALLNHGSVLFKQGRAREAEELFRRALRVLEEARGPDHADTLTAVSNLGLALKQQGELAEAELFLRRNLEGRWLHFGQDHPESLLARHNLASLLAERGQSEQAESHYRQALRGLRASLGENHPRTLVTLYALGSLLSKDVDDREGPQLLRQALTGYESRFAPDHPGVNKMRIALATALYRREDFEAATPLFRRALDAAAGQESSAPLLRARLGSCLLHAERYEEAERELLAAQAALELSSGSSGAKTGELLESIVLLYRSTGRDGEAERYSELLKALVTAQQATAPPSSN